MVGYSAERNPYYNMIYTGPAEKAYPPFVYVFSYLLSRIVNIQQYYENGYFLSMYHETQFLTIIMILLVLQMIIIYEWIRTSKTGSGLVKAACAFCFIFSAPMLFSIERANTIIITVFFVGVFLFLHNSPNKLYKETALLSLAIAAAIKMTPAFLGILLLYNKQWKEAIRTVIYGLLFFFVPFLFFDGGLANIWKMLENMQIHFSSYTITEGCTLVANICYYFNINSETAITSIKVLTYVITAFLLLFALYYKSKWEVLMAISIILVILPSHSGAYCVLYLFPAIIAFLNAERHDVLDLVILLACFCIMNDVQHNVLSVFLNYHMGILLIMFVMMIKGVQVIKEKHMLKETYEKVEMK
ncbi:MAG: glycosyltransferase 87 family protein [Clostridium sp.]|nr:glycosyltransferase 87 family protein [Clostridium sp.]